jgi:transposase
LFKRCPILYLDEAKAGFIKEFDKQISCSTVSRILKEAGMSYKYLERRAIQIAELEVCDKFRLINVGVSFYEGASGVPLAS